MDIRQVQITDYDYPLKEEDIASYPLKKRDESKLLVHKLNNGVFKTDRFKNIDSYLPENTLLVFNNTKVVRARLIFYKDSSNNKNKGARIEIFCLEPYEPKEIATAFAQKAKCSFKCLIGNNKKWKDDSLSIYFEKICLKAVKKENLGDSYVVEFSWTPSDLSFAEVLEAIGNVPLPPYIKRCAEKEDANTYQTVFAQHNGSVAAPTAGLHFTENLIEKLCNKGIETTFLTLHVGAGTFMPVKTECIGEHNMHKECISINSSCVEALLRAIKDKKSIIPIGTTSMRSLESLYWFGIKLYYKLDNPFSLSQWEVYERLDSFNNIGKELVLEGLLNYLRDNDSIEGETALMIAPGYDFKLCSGIITNFHQPKSTLLLLISALIGKEWEKAYKYALDNDFRFLSYGDSCLFLK